MKIIISHDVDHLFGRDHWLRDMIYPKLWIRSTVQLITGKITTKEWWLRCTSCFQAERHNLFELMNFDREHGVDSTFFFGMEQGLGMSYRKEEAESVIKMVIKNGFDVGVHGISYNNREDMLSEYNSFHEIAGIEPCGIRMHYVRFDDSTFDKLSQIGYAFDSTEFDECNNGTIKEHYQVGKMVEFPLTIMDGYLPAGYDDKKQFTLNVLKQCRDQGLNYVSILFHDYQFCDAYLEIRDWYIWLINYLQSSGDYQFISYKKAVSEIIKNV